MKRFRLVLSGVVLASALLGGGPLGCGAGGGSADTVEGQNEEKAERLHARAKEKQDIILYRRLIERFEDTQAAGAARDELAVLLINEAEAAIAKRDWSTAEARAEEARTYAGLQNTRRAMAVLDKIDEERAAVVAKESIALAEQGKCASALKEVAAPVRKKPRERFKSEVQKLTREALVACLAKKLEAEVAAGNNEAARMMVNTPDATAALSKQGYEEAQKVMLKLIVKKSTSAIGPMLEKQEWKQAIAKLKELQKQGVLKKNEYGVAFELVQDAIAAHLLKLAKQGITADKPSSVEEDIAEQAEIAQWKRQPDELAEARKKLAAAIECEKVSCKLGAPRKKWAWGKIVVYPKDDIQGDFVHTIKHAEQVWVLAEGKDRALVATKDPGDARGAKLYDVATGWADPAHLRNTDTELWLPPREQLEGVRVWGPLRPGQPEYFLGTVSGVDGNKITVKRLADAQDVSVSFADLRVGKLPKGLKVMAFCVDELHPEPAKVDSVVTQKGGMPKVKVICDKGGKVRVEVGSALSSKKHWMLPRKP